jgi:hypothetical protein
VTPSLVSSREENLETSFQVLAKKKWTEKCKEMIVIYKNLPCLLAIHVEDYVDEEGTKFPRFIFSFCLLITSSTREEANHDFWSK